MNQDDIEEVEDDQLQEDELQLQILQDKEHKMDIQLIMSTSIDQDILPMLSEDEKSEKLLSLKTIHLEYLNIRTIENLELFDNLQVLFLQHNQISQIENMETLINLEYLSLHHNHIMVVQNLQMSRKLKYLDLSNNQIQEIKEIPESLEILKMQENPIMKQKDIVKWIIKNLKYLDELDGVQVRQQERFEALKIFPTELSLYQKHLNQHKMKKMMKFKKLQEMYDPDELLVEGKHDHVEDDDFLTQNSILQMQQQTEDLLHKVQDSKVEQLLVLKQELLEYQQLHEGIPEILKQFTEDPEEYAYVYWNLKNFEKAGGTNLTAKDIAINLKQTIKNKNVKAEILRVHIHQISNAPITTLKQTAGANNYLDIEFLKELLNLTIDKKELILESEELIDDEVDRYVPEKLKKIQNILGKLKLIFETDDLVQASIVESELIEEFNSSKNNKNEVVAILKIQKKNIETLHQSQIDLQLQKEPLFLNYQQHKKVTKFDNKLNRQVIEIESIQFGIFVQEQEQLNLQFQSYFMGQDIVRKMPQLQLSFALLINKEIQRKLEIVLNIDHMFAIKWDIDLSLCHYVSECSQGFLYFKMLSPPACYASYSGKQKYEITQFITDYLRIDNILLNWSSDNEIQRLIRINTTVIAIKVNDTSQIKTMLKSYNLFQMDISITQITPQIKDMRHLYLRNSKMPYSIKFNILSLISQNKLNDFNLIIKLIEYLDSKYRKQPNTIEISESTFQQCLRILSNINQNLNAYLQNYINFNKFKKIYARTIDEIIIINKNSQRLAFIRRVTVTPSGLIYLQKQPEETSAILRQHYQQMEHFIRVNFEDENQETILQIPYTTQCFYYDLIYPTMKILDKCYTLFTWSSSQLRNGSCWFLDLKSIPYSRSNLIMSIGNFMNLHPEETAKNAARLGQNLSSSFSLEFSGRLNITIIDDLKDQNGKLYSDGIGQISRDLIEQIRSNRDNRQISAIQIRYEGAKGVLVLNNELKASTIKLRKSMIKYQPSTMVQGLYGKRIQILDFNKFRGGYLNRQIIMLLITLGVPNESFMQLQAEYLTKIQNLQMKDASIYQYFNVEYNSDLQGLPTIQQTIRQLISHNYDEKNNWFLRGVMSRLKERGLLLLRTKTNILVQKAARLIGVLDEFKILKEDEIYCHRVSGPVVVTRNPCLHPGDVRILNAVGAEEIKQRFHSNPYEEFHHSIVFPQVGEAIPCKIAGGDLDGDIFFVSWDPRLIPQEQVESMVYDINQVNTQIQKVIDFQSNNDALHNGDVERMFKIPNMIEFLFSYLNSDVLGKIDNSHLAIADQSKLKAKDPRCCELAQLHSDAVDFVKHGRPVFVDQKLLATQWPDYMEKENKQTNYQSKTVIGELYRQVVGIYHEEKEGEWNLGYEQNNLPNIEEQLIKDLDKCQNEEDTIKLINEQYKQHINIALRTLIHIFEFLYGLFLTYSIKNEFEIYSGNFTNFTKGDGLYFKRKLNVENVQKRVISHIIQMKQEVDELIKENRNYIVSLMHLIMCYSPKMELNKQPILNYFINNLLIELGKEKKWNTLINNFNTWYRGCTWFLFWKDLLPNQIIQENEDNEEELIFI